MKVAGTSIECALWKNCNNQIDTYTGTSLKSELDSEFNMSPTNNIKSYRILKRNEGIQYLAAHNQDLLLNTLIENKDIKNIKVCDPLCFEHTSPDMSREILEKHSDYRTISVVRNPFDVLVSYYWWSFNVEDSIFDSFNQRYSNNKRLISSMCPESNDTIFQLRKKMEKFYNLPASFNNSYRQADKNKNVLEWLSSWQNEFYMHNIDSYITYESLNKSYSDVLNSLDLKFIKIPKFKSKNRKAKYHFSEYFNDKLKKEAYCLFEESCEKFNYSQLE